MAKQTSTFPSAGSPRKPESGRSWRVTAFWSVVGIIGVAGLISVSVESRLRTAIASSSPAPSTNLALPQTSTLIPLNGEPDFIERFGPEKRNARQDELPAQF